LELGLGGAELGAPDDEELKPVDGGVAGAIELEPDDVDGGVVGAMLDEDDEPVLGEGVVDDDDDEPDGDGVTTGGVFGEVVGDDSRLHPATPSTRPVQSSVTIAVFIEISREL
jgi:hypothetical protein